MTLLQLVLLNAGQFCVGGLLVLLAVGLSDSAEQRRVDRARIRQMRGAS